MGAMLLLLGSYGGSAAADTPQSPLVALVRAQRVAGAGAVAAALHSAGATRGAAWQPTAVVGIVKP